MHTDQLYEQYSKSIESYLTRFVHKEDARDLTQEVFAKAHASSDKFRGDSSVKTWLYSVATNAAKDHLKSRPYQALSKQVAISEIELEKYDAFSGPANFLEEKIDVEKMNACINEFIQRLPHNYSSILVLKELEGFSIKELSAILDISADTVKVRLHRARARLKDELEAGCVISTSCHSRVTCERKAT